MDNNKVGHDVLVLPLVFTVSYHCRHLNTVLIQDGELLQPQSST